MSKLKTVNGQIKLINTADNPYWVKGISIQPGQSFELSAKEDLMTAREFIQDGKAAEWTEALEAGFAFNASEAEAKGKKK